MKRRLLRKSHSQQKTDTEVFTTENVKLAIMSTKALDGIAPIMFMTKFLTVMINGSVKDLIIPNIWKIGQKVAKPLLSPIAKLIEKWILPLLNESTIQTWVAGCR